MHRRSRLLIAAAAGTAAALVVTRPDARQAWQNLRTYSAPGAGIYDGLAELLFGPYYRRLAHEIATMRPAGTMLEIGPGPGHLAVEVARRTNLSIVGVDIDRAMIDRARRRVQREGLADRVRIDEGDVANLPFADASFDLVVSSFSLHHWPDRAAGLAEIHRVVRPGGRAILWDVHPSFAHLETGEPTAPVVVAASPFRDISTEILRWPLGLPGVIRIDLRRADGAAEDETSAPSPAAPRPIQQPAAPPSEAEPSAGLSPPA